MDSLLRYAVQPRALLQEWDSLDYSMASEFMADVPRRNEAALVGLDGGGLFSKFVLTNTCPGARACLLRPEGGSHAACGDGRPACMLHRTHVRVHSERGCLGAGELANLTRTLYVEPLVGHLRHPHALEPCAGKGAAVRTLRLLILLGACPPRKALFCH